MKRLLLALLLLLISGCKYGSQDEALYACFRWWRRSPVFRYCITEDTSREVLGKEYVGSFLEVKKRFAY